MKYKYVSALVNLQQCVSDLVPIIIIHGLGLEMNTSTNSGKINENMTMNGMDGCEVNVRCKGSLKQNGSRWEECSAPQKDIQCNSRFKK